MRFFKSALLGSTAMLVLAISPAAMAGSIDVLVGQKDDYGGLCTSDSGPAGTCTWTGTPYYDTDARTAADKAATNGAQYTDEYDAVGYGPTPQTKITFQMPFTGTLKSGTLTVAEADLQPLTFGAMTYDINGVSVPGGPEQGYTADSIFAYTLTAAELAAANAVGMVDWDVCRCGSGDFVAFDWVELKGTTSVPEPASLTLLGTGLIGLGAASRRRRQKKLQS